MSDPLQKISVGEPFRPSAGQTNAFIDAAIYAREQKNRSGGPSLGASELPQSAVIVTVKNASGAAVDQFGVLGIDNCLITPTENQSLFNSRVMLSGVTPTKSAHWGRFVVLAEPLADGQIGRAYIGGIFPAKINIIASGDLWADVKNSDAASLESGGGGRAQILYKESGTGVKYAIVRIGGIAPGQIIYCALSQTGGSNGSATTAASWTYTATDAGGSQLGTTLSPSKYSRENGLVTAATKGVGYFGVDGAFVLLEAYEKPETGGCA